MEFGDTFVMTHLWIVISDPAQHGGAFIIANLTSNIARAGPECELNKGDHPWITHQCYLSFGDAREVSSKEETILAEFIASGKVTRHSPMAPQILQKIAMAARHSKALPIKYRKYFLAALASHSRL
jgi:hypothetical protein